MDLVGQQRGQGRVTPEVKDQGSENEVKMAGEERLQMLFSAPTYEQVRRFFSNLVHTVYRLEVGGPIVFPSMGRQLSHRITTQCSTASSSGQ